MKILSLTVSLQEDSNVLFIKNKLYARNLFQQLKAHYYISTEMYDHSKKQYIHFMHKKIWKSRLQVTQLTEKKKPNAFQIILTPLLVSFR